VRESVLNVATAVEVVLQIVHVHISVTETLAWRKVEVANDLVHTDAAFDTAALAALFVKVFAVVFALALLDALAATKRPRDAGVGITNFGARVATAGLLRIGWRWRTKALTAVVGRHVRCFALVTA